MVTIQDGITTVHGLFGATVAAPSWIGFIAPVAIILVFTVSAILGRRARR